MTNKDGFLTASNIEIANMLIKEVEEFDEEKYHWVSYFYVTSDGAKYTSRESAIIHELAWMNAPYGEPVTNKLLDEAYDFYMDCKEKFV